MLPASGFTTASANDTATAASTAFPPVLMMFTPTSVAYRSVVATIARGAATGGVDAE